MVKNDKKENDKADTDLLLKLTATKNSTPEGVRELGTCQAHTHTLYRVNSLNTHRQKYGDTRYFSK